MLSSEGIPLSDSEWMYIIAFIKAFQAIFVEEILLQDLNVRELMISLIKFDAQTGSFS